MKKNVLAVFGASAIAALFIMFGAFFAGPLLASASSNSSAQPIVRGQTDPYCQQYEKDLAGRLKVSVDTLRKDQIAAGEDLLNRLVKDGKLTKQQAQDLKQRLTSHLECRGHHRGFELAIGRYYFLKNYRQDIANHLAQSLHLSAPQLMKELSSGKSIADIARAQDVPLDRVRSTLTTTVMHDLNDAVKKGVITQQQATELKQFWQSHPQYVDRLLHSHNLGREMYHHGMMHDMP